MAKKVRRLTLERNRANGNASSLAEQLTTHEKAGEKLMAEIEQLKVNLKRAELGKASDSKAQEIRSLTSTLDDLRVKIARKDNEVVMYRSALKKEIGDDFDLEEILQKPGKRQSSKSGTSISDRNKKPAWRGRAQQILLLKSKVKRLSQELRHYRGDGEENSKRKAQLKKNGRPVIDVDEKVQEEIAAISEARKTTMESMGKEIDSLTKENIELGKRLRGSKARCSVLQGDNHKKRDQIKILLDKTGTDDALISDLRRQLQTARKTISQLSKRAINTGNRGGVVSFKRPILHFSQSNE